VGAETEAELLRDVPAEATTLRELARDDRIGGKQLLSEELGGDPVGLEDPQPAAGVLALARALGVAQLDPVLVGEVLDGLRERQVVDLAHERDDVARLTAAEAVSRSRATA